MEKQKLIKLLRDAYLTGVKEKTFADQMNWLDYDYEAMGGAYAVAVVNNGVLDNVSNSNEQKPIKYQCLFCNRSFKRRIPHNCKGGFRKRKIEWLPIYE